MEQCWQRRASDTISSSIFFPFFFLSWQLLGFELTVMIARQVLCHLSHAYPQLVAASL
jgi:hypothetical protein